MDKKKLLLLTSKPSMEEKVLAYLEKNPQVIQGAELYLGYYGVVMDTRSSCLPFYKHDDRWYLYGSPSGFGDMKLSDLDVPENSYVFGFSGIDVRFRDYRHKFSREDIDEILCVVDGGFLDDKSSCCADDLLGVRRYLDTACFDMEKCRCVCLHDWSEKALAKGFANVQNFAALYAEIKQFLVEHEFPYEPFWKNEFQHILGLSNMTLTQFCEYFHIRRSTAENWKYGVSKCPVYVLELMEYKLLHEGII